MVYPIKKHFLLLLLLVTLSPVLPAQTANSFQLASRLMQQQRYEEAIPILQELSDSQPNAFIFLDRLIQCHIQLKQYDTGLKIVEQRLAENVNTPLIRVIQGELYHFLGDTLRAYEIWEKNLLENPQMLQLYVNTANKLTERREFDRAIEVYLKAREVFKNDQLFMGDIPNVYMQAGEYQKAIGEWLRIIEINPGQSAAFKRLLIRYNDPLLYDDSVAEIEFRLQDMPLSHPAYEPFFQLQIWLLFENKLYRRAYAAALEYEQSTNNYNYALFNVARNLTENNEFELALKAYDFYTSSAIKEIRLRALEQKAEVYMRWAKYLADHNLDSKQKTVQYYQLASAQLDTIISESENYSRIQHVYTMKAEIALDFVFDLNAAKRVTSRLKSLPNMEDVPEANYLDGRIYLAEKAFTQARISFTRANKQAGTGELAEKTRYFLALTDFYAGDYEFAQIQLKSLGRQNTSYYANNALELRLWLQEGTAADTTGALLAEFADAHFKLNTGDPEQARQQLFAIASAATSSPFKDDAILLLTNYFDTFTIEHYTLISNYLESNPTTSVKENLMWNKARIADKLWTSQPEGCQTDPIGDTNPCFNVGTVIEFYETLILEYPQGLYASPARKRLAELPVQTNS